VGAVSIDLATAKVVFKPATFRASQLLSKTVIAVTAILWSMALPIRATTLYDSGTNSQTPPLGANAIGGSAVVANSFLLASAATLSSVMIDVLECCNQPEWGGTVSYYLFANQSGEPSSTPFAEGSTSSYLLNTIYDNPGVNQVVELEFNLTSPIALSANTIYWLGIGLSGAGSEGSPAWNAVVPTKGISAAALTGNFSQWILQAETGGFALYNTTFLTAPEPNSAWMFLGASVLAGLWCRRRKIATRRGE
jgi:hypothetical protein